MKPSRSCLKPQTTLHRDQRGAAAVEFALVAILLFMLVFGVIEWGRIFSEYQVMQSAAREGARVAAVRAPSDVVVTKVNEAATPYELSERPTVDKQCSDVTSGEPVTVTWKQHFEVEVGILPPFKKDLQIKGVMRCE